MGNRIRRLILSCAAGALAGSVAHAQAFEPTLEQLVHRAWTAQDGAPASVASLAQTADGFLWIGTATGLYRFDGVRFEEFEPPAGQALRSRNINMLHALPDGGLWIGYSYGGASLLAGDRLVTYGKQEGFPPGTVTAFARDSTGHVWVATATGLAELDGDRWHHVGADRGFPGGMTAEIMVDRRGMLWAGNVAGVYVLPRGARRFVWRAPSLDGKSGGGGAPREAPDGAVWGVSISRGLVHLSDVAGGPTPSDTLYYREPSAFGLLIDRQANAWMIGTEARLVRIPLPRSPSGAAPNASIAPQTLALSRAVGTSGTLVRAILEDREGNVWAGTEGGLDQFRAAKLTPLVLPQPAAHASVAVGEGGVVWIGTLSGLRSLIGPRIIAHPEVGRLVSCLYRDHDGGVWVGTDAGLWYSRGSGRFERTALPSYVLPADFQAIARDRDGTLWVSARSRDGFRGVLRRRGGSWERFRVPALTGDQLALVVVAGGAGHTWLGYRDNQLVRVAGDSVHVSTAADGLRVGNVTAIYVRSDRVWVGGDSGAVVQTSTGGSARFQSLGSGAPMRGVTGIVETADGDVWLNGADGVARVSAAEVARALANPAYRVRAERFGIYDGLEGPAPQVRPFPSVVAGTDGRLWFISESGVAWVDRMRDRRNRLPPPVHIGWLSAGGRRYPAAARVTLPPRTRSLAVEYTALSLAVPERVRFRYQLVGSDTGWQDAGTRREAVYTNLGPGAYRFRVIAANDDGVWNEAGAALDVTILPTFVQTDAFRVLCALAAAGALWGFVAYRQRRVARAIRTQFDAVLAERVRVARELHDTLLSDMAGMAMRLDAAAVQAASAPHLAGAVLPELRDQAIRTLDETRRAVTAMRVTADDVVPLWAQLADAARRVFTDVPVRVDVRHTGAPRRLAPEVEAEAFRIATEALVNARNHAHCRRVTLTCAYGRGWLAVTVQDDGRGFDAVHNGMGGQRNGHWGLVGMRERAAAIGGAVEITSTPERGTTVRLRVPVHGRTRSATHG